MIRAVGFVLVLVAAALAVAQPTSAAVRLQPSSAAALPPALHTAIIEPAEVSGPGAALALNRVRAAGATGVRTYLDWYGIAPRKRPARFNAADPSDPAYDWTATDAKFRLLARHGLEPIVVIFNGPYWTRLGPHVNSPVRPSDLRAFMRAAALRYNGRAAGLPRVRYWQVWMEPNLHPFLTPQFDAAGRPYSPVIYRQMVNAVAEGVKSVDRTNLVIAGGTAPFRDVSPETQRFNERWGPLTFMRELLCLSRQLTASCRQPIRFDIWAHHPYTSGSPRRRAVLPDDVSLGDLPDMRRVLLAGVRAGNVRSNRQVAFWVTEFSWDTRPPDPLGVPTALHARWTAEAQYRMWQNGVSLVTWLALRDEPFPASFYQSGLWYLGASLATDRPKPSLTAFRFPLVAFPHRQNEVLVWGRTPAGRQARVLVEQQFPGGWKRLGIVATNRNGIFGQTFRTGRTGFVRARTVDRSERAVPFSLRNAPERFFNPFGTVTGTIEG